MRSRNCSKSILDDLGFPSHRNLMKVFTAQQMRDFDKAAGEQYGVPSLVLMENAALRVVEFLEAKFAPLNEKKIVILCGKGNNGGDGFAIARNLGFKAEVFLLQSPESIKGDAEINFKICKLVGPGVVDMNALEDWKVKDFMRTCWQSDILIDAVLGTGFSGEFRGSLTELLPGLEGMKSNPHYRGKVVSVDVPSGTNSDTGQIAENCVDADYTITLAAPKRGTFVREGLEKFGEIWVGALGVPEGLFTDAVTNCEIIDLDFARATLPTRPIDAHKGDAGRALIIGGSFGMSGAVALASKAALNSGAGLCIAAIPEKILPSFAASILEATSYPLPCDDSGKLLESAADELPELWKNVQVVAIGPGISRSEGALKLVQRVVRECPVPLVIDADALHALPAIASEVQKRGADTILTPHPGEMGALMDLSAKEVNAARFEVAIDCAKKYGAFVVLKGARSLVATPDGRVFVNLTGNPGMATGGSGDVLTGTIAGLLAQMKQAENATKIGVYLHGFAGDLAFDEKGNGLVAGDIAANLGRALVEIPKREVEKINPRLRRLM
jgi:NAD(P)H-hydrate epimerase